MSHDKALYKYKSTDTDTDNGGASACVAFFVIVGVVCLCRPLHRFYLQCFDWPPSLRHHRSNGDCLESKRENYQVCSVQYCAQQLCMIVNLSVRDYVKPALKQLHWLPVEQLNNAESAGRRIEMISGII